MYLFVECCTGVVRIPVPLVARGIVSVPANLRCTRCGCVPREVEVDEVPKITVHGGPSDAADIPQPEPEAGPDEATRAEDAPDDRPEPAGDEREPDTDGDDQADRTDETATTAPRKRTGRKATKATGA